MITVKELNFSYADTKILNDINLDLTSSEFITILGPNGSGKTTLLKNLGKLLEPTEDTIFLNEKDIYHMSFKDIAKEISLLSQENYFDYEFSCYDIVMMGRFVHMNNLKGETEKDIEIVEKSMKYTNTFEFKDRSINELSGGEKQRVALARTIAQDSDIILLDEPITFLDVHHQIEIMKNIKKYANEYHKTIIAVLHDLNFANKFSDKLILLNKGNVMSIGKPSEVLTKENIKEVYGIDVDLHKLGDEIKYINIIVD